MHDRSMIINGSTQKASKVHILSTKTVQCLLPSCRVDTCGDRALQNCYSGKYHVFTGIRRPLSVTKNSKNSQLSQNSRFSTISTVSTISQLSQNSRFSTISTISTQSPDILRASTVRSNSLAYSKWIVINLINCHPNCHPLSDYKASELARLFDADKRHFSKLLSARSSAIIFQKVAN